MCPDGSLLTGFHGSRGGYGFGQLGVICSEVLPGYALGNPVNLPARGAGKFEVIDAYCDRDAGIRVLNIYLYARIVSGVRFSCVKPCDGSPAETENLTGGDPTLAAQSWTEQRCPDNEYATGVSIRYGKDVNALGLVCGQVPVAKAKAAPAPVERVDAGMENDTDRPGSDYDKFHIDDQRPDRRQSECVRQNDRCKAWTYVRAGIQHKYAVCYLKSEVPAAKPDKCCVSGVLPGKSAAGAMKDRSVLAAPADRWARRPARSLTPRMAAVATSSSRERSAGTRTSAKPSASGVSFMRNGPRSAASTMAIRSRTSFRRRMAAAASTISAACSIPRGRRGPFTGHRRPGAHAIYGPIRDAWAQQGWETGPLGYPTSDEFQDGKFRRVNFERGHIRWSPVAGIEVIQ